ncbi:MAG: aldehyde dehydrogenase family protein, partial [Loktanella sp.]|nr:aldehyde dehydrogenase family protein [Loktanella sp.]
MPDETMILPKPLNLIGGAWVPAASGDEMDVRSPLDGEVFTTIAASQPSDVDAAVKAARAAFDTGAWGAFTAAERGRLMQKMSLAILDEAEPLARLESRDNGKPLKQARADIAACARYFEYFGGAADKV